MTLKRTPVFKRNLLLSAICLLTLSALFAFFSGSLQKQQHRFEDYSAWLFKSFFKTKVIAGKN